MLWLKRYKRNLSKSAFFEGVGHLSENFRRKGRRALTTVGVRKLEWLPFRAVSKCPQCIVCFCHKARVWRTVGRTDGQTDRITTPKTLLPYLRGKNLL